MKGNFNVKIDMIHVHFDQIPLCVEAQSQIGYLLERVKQSVSFPCACYFEIKFQLTSQTHPEAIY